MSYFLIYALDDSPQCSDARNPSVTIARIRVDGSKDLAEWLYAATKAKLGNKGYVSFSLAEVEENFTTTTLKEMPSDTWSKEMAKKKGTLG